MIRQFEQSLPNGITLSCRAAGVGPVRVLMLHGFPEAAFAWDDILLGLAPRVAPARQLTWRPINPECWWQMWRA